MIYEGSIHSDVVYVGVRLGKPLNADLDVDNWAAHPVGGFELPCSGHLGQQLDSMVY